MMLISYNNYFFVKNFLRLLQRYVYPPSHHLRHSRYLPQHLRHPVADHKHNRTEKQGRQHLIHLPVMAEYSPQAGKIFFYYHMQQIDAKCTGPC